MVTSETSGTSIESQPHRLWVLWMMFFFQFAALGVYFTFLNVYFRQAGMSGTQIGLLSMAAGLAGVGSSVVWGYLNDRTRKPRLLISLGVLGTLIVAQFIPYVSGFWAFLVLGCLGSMMNTAPSTLVDSTTLVLLGKRREDYGRYRLGGSIGYIISGFVAGFIYDKIGLRAMFPTYGIVMLCFSISALLLPKVTTQLARRGSEGIGQMIRKPSWLLFIFVLFMTWITTNASMMFLNVALSVMGANQILIGISSTVPAIVEIPFMFFSGSLLRRYGPTRLIVVGMALMSVRFLLLGIMPAPEWAIGINILNGIAFVFFWNSAINYAFRLAPPGMAGTAQGMLTSTTSLAGVVSALLSGWLLDRLGPNGIFQFMTVLVLFALLLFITGQRLINRKATTSPQS
ncbi:MAG TPA: MFS transporter [Anaerolineaceae bacterium]